MKTTELSFSDLISKYSHLIDDHSYDLTNSCSRIKYGLDLLHELKKIAEVKLCLRTGNYIVIEDN